MSHGSWAGPAPRVTHGSWLMASWRVTLCHTQGTSIADFWSLGVLLEVRDTVHHRLLVMVLLTTVRVDAAGKRTEGSNSLKTTSEAVNHEVVPVAVNESAGA